MINVTAPQNQLFTSMISLPLPLSLCKVNMMLNVNRNPKAYSSRCAQKAADKVVLSHLFTRLTSRECLNEQANDLTEAFFFRVALGAHGLLGTGSIGRSFYQYL